MIQARTCGEEFVSTHRGPGALHHILRASVYDFGKAVNRVAQLFDMKPREILFPGKQAQRAKARSLPCYWAAKELGISTTSVANKPGMHQSSVSRKPPASRHRKKRINALSSPVLLTHIVRLIKSIHCHLPWTYFAEKHPLFRHERDAAWRIIPSAEVHPPSRGFGPGSRPR